MKNAILKVCIVVSNVNRICSNNFLQLSPWQILLRRWAQCYWQKQMLKHHYIFSFLNNLDYNVQRH